MGIHRFEISFSIDFVESVTEQIGTPSNIRLIESTTVSLTIGWTVSANLYTVLHALSYIE